MTPDNMSKTPDTDSAFSMAIRTDYLKIRRCRSKSPQPPLQVPKKRAKSNDAIDPIKI